MKSVRFFARIAVFGGFSLLAACQIGSGARTGSDRGGADVLGLGITNKPTEKLEKISVEELRAYCPRVRLRQGTAFFTEYERGGEGDRSKIQFQGSISDVTRSCKYSGDTLTMTVALAGKVVTGPAVKGNSASLPLRVVVLRGDEVLYSQLHPHQVDFTGGTGATQFLFNDPNVQFPRPSKPNILVYVGFDGGNGKEN